MGPFKRTTRFAVKTVVGFVFLVCISSQAKQVEQVYEPTWESLAKHNIESKWFKDAKFGIYFTWGPFSVPAFDGDRYYTLLHAEEPATAFMIVPGSEFMEAVGETVMITNLPAGTNGFSRGYVELTPAH